MDKSKLNAILAMNREPSDPQEFDEWLHQHEILPFLENDSTDADTIIYAGLQHVFIHSILVPRFAVTSAAVESLLQWNFSVTSGWSLVSSRDSLSIEHALAHERDPIIKDGEPIVFHRTFEGVKQKESYFELNQRIAHILGLHLLEERKACCTLNRHGDIDAVVSFHRSEGSGADRFSFVTMRRSELAYYAAASDQVLLRMFDFNRFRAGDMSAWNAERKSKQLDSGNSIFGKLTTCGQRGSYSRGIQIIDLGIQRSDVHRRIMSFGNEEGTKQYASFIAHDLRSGNVGEISCDPREVANYFEPSSLPYETSPAFFRAEVLTKYKADSEKYTINDRSISCRGSWHLRSFGVNEAGQIHAYLCYLRELPYEEQLHWKQFNECPRAGLAESVITTDFKGEFCDEYDPLPALKQRLQTIDERRVGWWQLKSEVLPNKVQYPFTDTREEWASELMNLDQLLVEGLVDKWLKKRAIELGRNPDVRFRSLKLVEECLCGLGFDEDHAKEIMAPWHQVHELRSRLKGHASGSEGREYESTARKVHGNLVNHFRWICQECEETLGIVSSAMESCK